MESTICSTSAPRAWGVSGKVEGSRSLNLNLEKVGSALGSSIVASATNKGITVVPFNLFWRIAHSYLYYFNISKLLIVQRILNKNIVLSFRSVDYYPLKCLQRDKNIPKREEWRCTLEEMRRIMMREFVRPCTKLFSQFCPMLRHITSQKTDTEALDPFRLWLERDS